MFKHQLIPARMHTELGVSPDSSYSRMVMLKIPLEVLTAIILGAAGCVLYSLLKRRPLSKQTKFIPPIEDVLRTPDQIQVNLRSIHTPPLSGYPLRALSYLYYTAFGNYLVSGLIKSKSNLDLFANQVIPEAPTLKYVPAPPSSPDDAKFDNRSILTSLIGSWNRNGEQQHSVSDFYLAYKAGKCIPLDVAHAVLAAIKDSNERATPLRAITACDHISVLSMTKASTERSERGSQLSLLDGVPISIKEDFCTNTYPLYCGATFMPKCCEFMTESDIVRKLCNAGAVVIGVTNMPELGSNAIGSSENLIHKQPRNPHNIDYFPGGSSSGCGVSVAAGLGPISIGGDGGGSGRVPASVCGAFALKLTQDRLHDAGSYASKFSFSVVSPICSSSLDLAVVMDVLCNSTEDKLSIPLSLKPLLNAEASLSGVTIGVYWDWIEHADKETVAVFRQAVNKLRSLGANFKEIKIPELEEIRVTHVITAVSELSTTMSADVDEHFHEMGPGPLIVAAMGHQFSSTEVINAMKQRTRAVVTLKAVFKEVDIIATPTTGCIIPRITPEYLTAYGIIDGKSTGDLETFTYCANFTGVPAITIPVGVVNQELGLPVGLQLMALWYQETHLIKYAMSIEASGLFPMPRPIVWYDTLPLSQLQS